MGDDRSRKRHWRLQCFAIHRRRFRTRLFAQASAKTDAAQVQKNYFSASCIARPETGAFCYTSRVIYLFHGSDVARVRAKAFEWISKARAKEPHVAYLRLSKDELNGVSLEAATAVGGLFVTRALVLIDDPYARARAADDEEAEAPSSSALDEHLEALAASDNAIVVLAPKLLASKVKKITKLAAKTYVYDLASTPAARGFNAGLVNAMGARDRHKLWLEVVRALRAGDAPELLHGLLHWKARDLLEKGGRVWTPEEARALSLRLITLLQESRRKGLDLSLELEKFALALKG